MPVEHNQPLKKLNTFGMDVSARFLARIRNQEELSGLLASSIYRDNHHLVLGGGSNILFTGDFDGLVIHMDARGMEVVGETSHQVFLKVQAGEPWDPLVAFCVDRGWGGLENLSLIPGQAGSSPVQNIGAYGAELKDCFHSLEALEKDNGKMREFSREECQFKYRDSYFKQEGRDRFIIMSVTFCLNKAAGPNTRYGNLDEELESMGCRRPGIAHVREAVCRIRRRKLPDPQLLGNAGSFFKNPVVGHGTYSKLKERFPGMVAYPGAGQVKLAAGWLIEQAGWKGVRQGEAGVHSEQALVLVNHGNASGAGILQLAREIMQSVEHKYGIRLEPEVLIV